MNSPTLATMSTEKVTEDVILSKERYIPVSKEHFLSTLLDKFDNEKSKETFGKLCTSIETLFKIKGIEKIEVS